MKRYLLPLGLSAILLTGACAQQAGIDNTYASYGDAILANFENQDAYNQSSARLRNLAIDFAATTRDTVTFAFDKSTLDAQARQALDGQAKWLRDHPEVRMTITGHADLVGSERYNQGLGLRRARRVVAYLARRGVSKNRLDAVESRGESEPVVKTENRERRNRRTVTTVAGFARNYVGTGMDGELAQRVYNRHQAGNFGVREASSSIN